MSRTVRDIGQVRHQHRVDQRLRRLQLRGNRVPGPSAAPGPPRPAQFQDAVLISQNRQAGRADVRGELDYETNVRSEIWSRAIADRIGVDPGEVERRIKSVIDADRQKLRKAQAD